MLQISHAKKAASQVWLWHSQWRLSINTQGTLQAGLLWSYWLDNKLCPATLRPARLSDLLITGDSLDQSLQTGRVSGEPGWCLCILPWWLCQAAPPFPAADIWNTFPNGGGTSSTGIYRRSEAILSVSLPWTTHSSFTSQRPPAVDTCDATNECKIWELVQCSPPPQELPEDKNGTRASLDGHVRPQRKDWQNGFEVYLNDFVGESEHRTGIFAKY